MQASLHWHCSYRDSCENQGILTLLNIYMTTVTTMRQELDRQQCAGASSGQQPLAPVVGSSRWRQWWAAAAGASGGQQPLAPVVSCSYWRQWWAEGVSAIGAHVDERDQSGNSKQHLAMGLPLGLCSKEWMTGFLQGVGVIPQTPPWTLLEHDTFHTPPFSVITTLSHTFLHLCNYVFTHSSLQYTQ